MGARGRAGAVALAAAIAVLAACTADRPARSSGDPTPPTSSGAPPSAESSPAPTSSAPSPSRPGPLTIALAGDVHFEGPLAARLDDPAGALAPATKALAEADLALVNLETAITTGGRPEPGKRYTFRAPPAALAALAAAGIDVATLANNHALDFGRPALDETFAAVRAAREADPPLQVIGVGRDARAAFRPARFSIGGADVRVIAATTAGADPTADPTGHWAAGADRPGTADALDPARLLGAVRRAAARADVVVAFLHWGVQGDSCPSGGQRGLAADLVAAGADLVVGSHAHRLQGDGRLGRGYVAYGLGNYAWYTPGANTGVLTLTVQPAATPSGRARVRKAAFEPARIGADGLPHRLTGAEATAARAERVALRGCAGLR